MAAAVGELFVNTTDTNMVAGQMRTRLWIQVPTRTTESTLGERSVVFADSRKVWVQLSPLAGRELERGKAVHATVSHVVIFRFDKSILPDHRFRLDARVFSINALIDVDNRQKKHAAYCTEVVSI